MRAFVTDRFLPVVRQHWRNATFPTDLVPEMAELGCFGGSLHGYGCAGLSALEYGIVMRELERGDTGLRTLASVQGALVMQAIADYGSDEQKKQWLPELASGRKLACFALTEPTIGSDPAHMTTRARRTPRGWVLDGDKRWIGNATVADVALVWARIDDAPDQSPARSIRGFLVERNTPGYEATLIEGKLSLRAAITGEIRMRNCTLPAHAILEGARGLSSTLACLDHARFSIAWGVVGAAMACFDEARRHALNRIQFNAPIASFQLVQAKLARMLTRLTHAQLMAFRLAALKSQGHLTTARISMAKLSNVEAAIEVARDARDLMGADGILDENQCFRHMCNLESVRTYEGTEHMHTLILGREITGIPAFACAGKGGRCP